MISKAWISPADDLGLLLEAEGDPFKKDGRWVLTNGPDIAPLKTRIFKNRPFTLDQKMPEIKEGGEIEWAAPGTGKLDKGN